MSYDIWLEADLGGPEPSQILHDHWNCTSNVAPMWRRAGADLADFHGRTAGECRPLLAAAIAAMEGDPATYKAMDPPNGWGDYAGCVDAMNRLDRIFKFHPAATVRVSR